jgi:hypothetical protein
MTQSELKRKLCELVESYFGSATVTWGKTRAVSPNVPQVVLNMGTVTRPYQPITRSVDGVPVNEYPSKTTVQIDLYTKGAPTSGDPDTTAAYENTAINDLTDFVNFLNSVYVDHWSGLHDVSLLANTVLDLTELINDVTWDYRAMVEVEIGFTQSAVGHTGTMFDRGTQYYANGRPRYDAEGYALDENDNRMTDADGNLIRLPLDDDGDPIFPFTETPSGGRTPELAGQTTGWFEQVENPENLEGGSS